jgi:cytochrome c553
MGRCVLVLLAVWSASVQIVGGQQISYSRDVAPLIARRCLECHGPDAAQRESELRLDSRDAATARLPSGKTAVVPGNPSRSELVRRITASGDERMPPPESGQGLIDAEIKTLRTWVREGASWESHWSFTPPHRPQLAVVKQASWTRSPIDRFILSELERTGRAPLVEADRRTLIRRIYFDLLGLPPTPSQVAEFLNDRRPDAWKRLLDRLLSSPLYGQRWGRHWLDVARYGDSNGGDENHAYPLAWRYRDYVIAAFNDDLPFDQFVQEQVAGDLLNQLPHASSPSVKIPYRYNQRVTATGFLALGTKILAEQDKVKMRADVVDEQVDTLGKVFLALTLGCARCHDHKFDPIPSTDYYALAGIFHSTELSDQALTTDQWQKQQANYDRRLNEMNARKSELEQQIEEVAGEIIDRQAEKFDRGNVSVITDGYGEGIGIISDPGSQQNFAEYDIQIAESGLFLIQLRYAAQTARPGKLLINGKVVREKAISQVTGGWMPQHQRWFSEGMHTLGNGNNVLRIESAPLMSHIDRIRLIRFDDGGALTRALERLRETEVEIEAHKQRVPQPVMVMAVRDGQAHDVRLHLRGSHLALGDTVSRGFPDAVSARRSRSGDPTHKIGDGQSGRLQLARWMTDGESGAGGQVARVIANRMWHFHFGRGLVTTPDNFGVQGKRPTHPKLLDWLALELIDNGWSLKSLHRQIVSSATYRQRSVHHASQDFRGVPRRRLEAEAIRDSLLFHGGRLDCALVGEPLSVKSQDPSPEDLQRNEQTYRSSPRRSVYLPVVRSNVYRFLTLFDFPNAATPVGKRDRTTVPTQALLLLNDPFVMRQAEYFARNVLENQGVRSEEQRIVEIYQRLFSRPPSVGEQNVAKDFLREFRATVTEGEPAIAAWASLCHTLILSGEFIYVD